MSPPNLGLQPTAGMQALRLNEIAAPSELRRWAANKHGPTNLFGCVFH